MKLAHNEVELTDSLRRYLHEISKTPLLSRAEELTLIPAAQAGDREAHERVIQANLRFVVTIANEYRDRGLPLSELISEGNIGLIHALDRFDTTRGIKFITYAKWWVRHAIVYAIVYKSHVVRIPQSQLRKIRARRAEQDKQIAAGDLMAEHLQTSSDDPITAEALVHHLSLEQNVSHDSSTRFIEFIENQDAGSPEREVMDASLRADLELALAQLQERHAEILKMLFGFDDDTPKKLGDVADKYGISRERVRQIRNYALEKLRNSNDVWERLIPHMI